MISQLKIKLIHGIHQSIIHGAIPIQVAAFFSIKTNLELGQPLTSIAAPVATLVFFVVYPVATYFYLSKRIDKLSDVDEREFRQQHKAAFSMLRYYR